VLIDGERYDIGGDPHSYLATLNALAPAPKPPPPSTDEGATSPPSAAAMPLV